MGCLSISPDITWGHMQLNSSDGRTGGGSPRWPLFSVSAGYWLACLGSPHRLSSS